MPAMETDGTLIDSLQRQLRERREAPAYRWGASTLSHAGVESETHRIAVAN